MTNWATPPRAESREWSCESASPRGVQEVTLAGTGGPLGSRGTRDERETRIS